MKSNLNSKMLSGVKAMAESSLKTSANSATCGFLYQPKAPAALSRYEKKAK